MTGRRRTALIAALVLAEIVAAFELAMLFVAIPSIGRDLDIDTGAASWTLTAYLLVAASASAVGGRLGDLYGRRRVMLTILVLGALGSVVSLVGDDLGMLIVGRAIQGTTGAVLPLAFAIAREHLPTDGVGVALSMIGASALIAGSLGAIVSGVVLDLFSWHYLFLIAAVLSVLAYLVSLAWVPRSNPPDTVPPFDLVGAILLPVTVACLLIPVTNAPRWGWTSPGTVGLFVVGLIVFVAWVVWERRCAAPVVDLKLLGIRQMRLVFLSTFALGLGALGGLAVLKNVVAQAPETGSVGLGLSATTSGVITACTAFAGYAVSPLAGRVASRFGGKYVMVASALTFIVALLALIVTSASLFGVVVLALMSGIGGSLMLAALPILVVELIPERRTAEVTGANNLVRNVGQAAATTLVGVVLAISPDPVTNTVSRTGMNVGGAIMLAICLVSLAAALMLRARPLAPARGDRPVTVAE